MFKCSKVHLHRCTASDLRRLRRSMRLPIIFDALEPTLPINHSRSVVCKKVSAAGSRFPGANRQVYRANHETIQFINPFAVFIFM